MSEGVPVAVSLGVMLGVRLLVREGVALCDLDPVGVEVGDWLGVLDCEGVIDRVTLGVIVAVALGVARPLVVTD